MNNFFSMKCLNLPWSSLSVTVAVTKFTVISVAPWEHFTTLCKCHAVTIRTNWCCKLHDDKPWQTTDHKQLQLYAHSIKKHVWANKLHQQLHGLLIHHWISYNLAVIIYMTYPLIVQLTYLNSSQAKSSQHAYNKQLILSLTSLQCINVHNASLLLSALQMALTLLAEVFNINDRSISLEVYVIQESLANAKVSTRQPCWTKTDFDVKLALKVILGHSFCNQLQADKG